MEEKGIVFDIQKYSVHDGPGIRTLVFLKVCPLKCIWCQNPEGIDSEPQLLFYPDRCTGCGDCVGLDGCIATSLNGNNKAAINWSDCTTCGQCVAACLNNAREIAGKTMTVDEVIDEVKRDAAYYRRSNGGMTLSGGDPVYQIDFSRALLKEAKKSAIHTALETSGYCSEKSMDKIIDYVDLFLFDIKHMDPVKHKEFTGVDNEPILRNLKKIASMGKELVMRIPLIPGINDDDDNLKKTAVFLKENSITDKVDFMPYHRLGVNKYSSIGRDYKLPELKPSSEKTIRQKCAIFEDYGFTIRIEGFIESNG